MDIGIGFGLKGLLYLRVLHEDLIDVGAGVLVQPLVASADDDDGYFHIAKDAQFVGLLQQTVLPLAEGNLGSCVRCGHL